MAGLRPAGQIPQRGGELGRGVVAGVQHPDPAGDLGGQVVGEVVRAQPHPFAQLTEPAVPATCFAVRPGPGHRLPTAVTTSVVQLPSQSRVTRVERVVLAALPGQQPVGQPVAVVGAHQVPGADHAGQRHPQRRSP